MDSSKVIVSAVSVVIGTLLTLMVTLGREWRSGKKLQNGLLAELGDLQRQLERMMLITKRQLQVHANHGIDPACFALPLSNLFFKTYFKDVFNRLSSDQRNSYQLIHSTVDSVNRHNEELIEAAQKLHAPTGF